MASLRSSRNTTKPNEPLVLGRLGRPLENEGWFHVIAFGGEESALWSKTVWQVKMERGWQAMEVAKTSWQGKKSLALFRGLGNAEELAQLAGREVGLFRRELPAPPPGEYYWADLLGMKVQNLEGKPLGEVEEIFSSGAHDVLVLASGLMIPFLRPILREVSMEKRLITMYWEAD